MTSHTRRVLELGVGLGLALTLVLTVLADWHQRTAARVRADTIRLHILANSDTWDDQLLKLQVRDAVLAAIQEAVNIDLLKSMTFCQLQQPIQMCIMAVDTTVGQQTI